MASILLEKANEIDINQITKKIFVSQPYFAFNKIYKFGDILIAPIIKEQQINFESTPMSSAEASRHLAILGSCALAIKNQNQQYYLAVKARKRAGKDILQNKHLIKENQLYVLAMPTSYGENQCAALTSLVTLDGKIIFDFKVGYQILSEKLFSRIFRKHKKYTKKIELNPYCQNLKFKNIIVNNNVLDAEFPVLKTEQCVGHFNNFPIPPIGMLAYMAINTLEDFLGKITGNSNLKYYLISADMNIFIPVFIGDDVKLIVNYLKNENGSYSFSWIMKNMSSGEILNNMQISFMVSHEIIAIEEINKTREILNELNKYKIMYAELAYSTYQQDKMRLYDGYYSRHQIQPSELSVEV